MVTNDSSNENVIEDDRPAPRRHGLQTMKLVNKDPAIRSLLGALGEVGFLAGGAARKLVTGMDEPNDLDIFLYGDNEGDANASLTRAVEIMRDLGYVEKTRRLAITFELPSVAGQLLPVQIVVPFRDAWQRTYGTPVEVLSQFAFTVQQFAVESIDGNLVATYSPMGIEDTHKRTLRVTSVGSPPFLIWSAMKYGGKGYRISIPEIGVVLENWADRPQEWRDAELKNAAFSGDADGVEAYRYTGGA